MGASRNAGTQGDQQVQGQAPVDEGQQQVQGQAPVEDQQQPQGTGLFDGPFDEARAKALIEKLRPFEQNAKELKGHLTDAQARLKEFEDADKSEVTRLSEQVNTVLENNKAILAENRKLRVQVRAATVGIIDPAAASALLDWAALGEEFTDAELDAALNQMATDRPWLKATGQVFRQQAPTDTPATNGSRTPQDQGARDVAPGMARVRQYYEKQAHDKAAGIS